LTNSEKCYKNYRWRPGCIKKKEFPRVNKSHEGRGWRVCNSTLFPDRGTEQVKNG